MGLCSRWKITGWRPLLQGAPKLTFWFSIYVWRASWAVWLEDLSSYDILNIWRSAELSFLFPTWECLIDVDAYKQELCRNSGSWQGSVSEADAREAYLDFGIHACWSPAPRCNSWCCGEGIPLWSEALSISSSSTLVSTFIAFVINPRWMERPRLFFYSFSKWEIKFKPAKWLSNDYPIVLASETQQASLGLWALSLETPGFCITRFFESPIIGT